jgi:hypothetical protein
MPPDFKNNNQTGVKSSDETTPLLAGIEQTPLAEPVDPVHQQADDDDLSTEGQETEEEEEKPLPRGQIFLLCYTAVVEPIAFFGIFPYINFMIEKVGNVEKEDVGFYSGLIESLFSATQMCVMIFWGKVRVMELWPLRDAN